MKLRYQLAIAASVVLAVATAIPGHAHKANMLGYYSVCSFVPASTVILLAIAAVLYTLGVKRSIMDELKAAIQAKKKAKAG